MAGVMNGIRAGSSVLQWAVQAVFLLTIGDLSAGTRAGNFYYKGEVKQLDGRTIDVSDTMVALTGLFRAEITRDTTVIVSETPSIFLVIDNSATMSGPSSNDSAGLRFTMASAFVDSVYAKYPGAEMGLAVFGTHLYFDPNDRPYFVRCSTQAMGAYIPLLKLDSAYNGYGGQTGYQILKSILSVSTYGSGANQFTGLTYQSTDITLRGGGCNLTAGFDAAKEAMTSAKASQCGRYVFLFSDGNANAPGGDTTWYFRDSVQDVPTTISVYFPAGTVPASIQTMTNNIRVNGYDTLSPHDSGCTQRSNYWPYNSVDLTSLLQNQVWECITAYSRVSPTLIIVNGMLSTFRSGDTAFLFNNYMPLTGQITPVNIQIICSIYHNNTKVKDTIITSNITIRTMPQAAPVWNPVKDSFDIWAWDRDLVFRHNNNPIQFIADTMDSVELYFTFDSGTAHYGYDHVYIDLYNKIIPIDSQSIQLTRISDNVFAGKFKRELSMTANRGEYPPVLQYRGNNDSVIAVFRNRENLTSGKVRLPLDTLRVVMPLAAPSAVFYGGSQMPLVGETWKAYSDNGRVRVHLPSQTLHSVKIYSLTGQLVASREMNQGDALFQLPRGVYCVRIENPLSGTAVKGRVVNK